jgi:hypothetical protein
MTWCQPSWTTGKLNGFSRYTICRHGKVVNDETKTVLKGSIAQYGYRQYNLRTDEGEKRRMTGHRLVALAFLPNPEQKQQVDHLDRNKLNNHILNLRWATPSENNINKSLRTRKNYCDEKAYRHIRKRMIYGIEYYVLQIRRNSKILFYKSYRTDQYTIDQVVKIRNELYKIHNITIQDE